MASTAICPTRSQGPHITREATASMDISLTGNPGPYITSAATASAISSTGYQRTQLSSIPTESMAFNLL